jgi:predicted SnoaL-like aldol condensation-catalyzing enzyme
VGDRIPDYRKRHDGQATDVVPSQPLQRVQRASIEIHLERDQVAYHPQGSGPDSFEEDVMNSSTATAKRSHKDAAVKFLELCSRGSVSEAYDLYVGRNFRHHNPWFAGDAKSLAAAMAENAAENPDKEFEAKRAIEEGDFVAVHGRVRHTRQGPDHSLVHIFRFEDDRIAELWDVGQEAIPNSPNVYGLF